MVEAIRTRQRFCAGCSRCVRECPMETANVTFLDKTGNRKTIVDYHKCVSCGRCVTACKHGARVYVDDTKQFFGDLGLAHPISLIVSPSIAANIPHYKRVFTYLKRLGVSKIYDAALGGDIHTWAHIRYMESTGGTPLISQTCPSVVLYIKTFKQELIKHLSPVHSPMACTAIFMKEYCGIAEPIAALTPCISAAVEFEETGLIQYNITFKSLLDHLELGNIELPEEETDYDNAEAGLGFLYSMSGGLKSNIEFFLGNRLHVANEDGPSVYNILDGYTDIPDEHKPDLFELHNCNEGCNKGNASSRMACTFAISKMFHSYKNEIAKEERLETGKAVHEQYDKELALKRFMRGYTPVMTMIPAITENDIDAAFQEMGKNSFAKRHVDCSGCGNRTCYAMARKIALGVNIPENCILKIVDDAKMEHEMSLRAREKVLELEKKREADERIRLITEEAQKENEFQLEKLDRVVKAANIGLYDIPVDLPDPFSPEKTIIFDHGIRRLLGYKNTLDLPNKVSTWITLMHPDDRERVLAVAEAHMMDTTDQTPFDVEFRILKADGEYTFVRSSGSTFRDEEGYPLRSVGTIIDVSNDKKLIMEAERQREAAERAKKETEYQLIKMDMVVKATNIGLYDVKINTDNVLDPECPFMMDDGFRRILGYGSNSEDALPNTMRAWLAHLHPDDKDNIIANAMAHVHDKTGRTPYDIEYRIRKADGDYTHIRATGTSFRDEEGNPYRMVGAVLDVSEAKRLIREAEEQRAAAESANQAKSVFLSHISHEIRTPLNAVLGTAEIELQKDSISPEIEEAFNRIQGSGKLLLGIINSLLDFSKIEAGKMEIIPSNYNLPGMINDIIQINVLMFEGKGIQFNLDMDENLPRGLRGDELRIKQVLNNILSNAFKYTHQGEVQLSVSGEMQGGQCMMIFNVRDTGQGMTKRQLAKLFEEYTRFNLQSNRSIMGTGLGMTITKRLLEMMNGDISIESTPDVGTVVTVRLPQKITDATICGAETVKRLRSKRFYEQSREKKTRIEHEYMPYGKILVIDDVETNLYVAKGLMLPYGLQVETGSSGMAAIEKVTEGHVYDIIFMDHMMPKMNGIEATRIIRETGYTHPIVALTANAQSGQAEKFIADGFDYFISNPVDIRELDLLLNRLVRDKQPPEVIEAARRFTGRKKPAPSVIQEAAVQDSLMRAAMFDVGKSLDALDALMPNINHFTPEELLLFHTHVHGIKSTLLHINEKDLSTDALKLELAANENRMDVIIADGPAFVEDLHRLYDKNKPTLSEAVDAPFTPEDKALLHNKLTMLKTACKQVKKSVARAVLDDLKKRRWPADVEQMLEDVSVHLLHGAFKKIVSIVEEREGEA